MIENRAQELIEKLKDVYENERFESMFIEGYYERMRVVKSAFLELIELGEGAVPSLIEVLNNNDLLREEAMHALQKIGKPAVHHLIDRIEYKMKNPGRDEFGEEINIISIILGLRRQGNPEAILYLERIVEEYKQRGDNEGRLLK